MNFKKPKFWDYQEKASWSILLLPLSIIYLLIVWISRIPSIFKTYPKYLQPIICVGNIYLGGTGKTPLASEIFKFLKSKSANVAPKRTSSSVISKRFLRSSFLLNFL